MLVPLHFEKYSKKVSKKNIFFPHTDLSQVVFILIILLLTVTIGYTEWYCDILLLCSSFFTCVGTGLRDSVTRNCWQMQKNV